MFLRYALEIIVEIIWFVPGVLFNMVAFPYGIIQNMRDGLTFHRATQETIELYKELFSDVFEEKSSWINEK